MNPPSEQPQLQQNTLTLYGELVCRPVAWPGELIFSAFPGASRTGLSAAGSLVGAASLVVDPDPAAVHAQSRDCAFDFTVTSLDEALRTLKNEIRQRRPLSVALLADPVQVTAEAAERGLAPRLILSGPDPSPPSQLPGGDEVTRLQWADPLRPSPPLSAWLRDRNWLPSSVRSPQPGAPGGGSLAVDAIRSTWLRRLSTYQRSVRNTSSRWLWLSPEEKRLVDLDPSVPNL